MVLHCPPQPVGRQPQLIEIAFLAKVDAQRRRRDPQFSYQFRGDVRAAVATDRNLRAVQQRELHMHVVGLLAADFAVLMGHGEHLVRLVRMYVQAHDTGASGHDD